MNYKINQNIEETINKLIVEANGDLNLVIHCLNECKQENDDGSNFSYNMVKNKIIAYRKMA